MKPKKRAAGTLAAQLFHRLSNTNINGLF